MIAWIVRYLLLYVVMPAAVAEGPYLSCAILTNRKYNNTCKASMTINVIINVTTHGTKQSNGPQLNAVSNAINNMHHNIIMAEADDKQMHLQWAGVKWKWSAEDWFHLLDISAGYLIQKCHEKGVDAEAALKAWGNRLYRPTVSRKRTVEELFTADDAVNPVLPVERREKIETYNNTVAREAEQEAYANCKLPVPLLPAERSQCHINVICRPPLGDVNRTAHNDADYNEILSSNLPDEEKRVYERCQELGQYCRREMEHHTYPRASFTHYSNGGAGDCLFIAAVQYLHLVRQHGSFPSPHMTVPPMAKRYTTKTYMELRAPAQELRDQVCQYFRDHRDEVLLSGHTIRDDLAILNIEGTIYYGDTYRTQYNNIVETVPLLELPAIVAGVSRQQATQKAISVANNLLTADGNEEYHRQWQLFMNANFENYITHMGHYSTYGGAAEIAALSMILDKNILVLQDTGSALSRTLASNMGYMVRPEAETIYIYHLLSVHGKGSLHYEVMFPVATTQASSNRPLAARTAPTRPVAQRTARAPPSKPTKPTLLTTGLDGVTVKMYKNLLDFLVKICPQQMTQVTQVSSDELLELTDTYLQTLADDAQQNSNYEKQLDALNKFFEYNLENTNGDIYEACKTLLGDEAKDTFLFAIPDSTIIRTLKPRRGYDIVAHHVVKQLLVSPSILMDTYTHWFQHLPGETQVELILSSREQAAMEGIEQYMNGTPSEMYNTVEAHFILYTLLMPGVSLMRADAIQYEALVGPTKSVMSCLDVLIQQHMGQSITELTMIDSSDDTYVESAIAFIMSLSHDLDQNDDLRPLLNAIKYEIIRTYAAVTNVIIYLMSNTLVTREQKDTMVYIPDDAVDLDTVLELVLIMNPHVDVISDPSL